MVVADFTASTKPVSQSQGSCENNSNVRRIRSVVTKPKKIKSYAEPFESRFGVQFNPKNPNTSKMMSKRSLQDLADKSQDAILCVRCAKQLAILLKHFEFQWHPKY